MKPKVIEDWARGISISLPITIVEKIDAIRGHESRSEWIRVAIEKRMDENHDRV